MPRCVSRFESASTGVQGLTGKILVTGATGFLGRALVAHLRKESADVIAIGSKDADLTKQGSLDPYRSASFESIFHLAAWTQAGDFCLRHMGEQWIVNQLINAHLLQWWAEHQPQAKLISMGTSCSYPVDLPLEEPNYLSGRPIDDLFTYAMTKRMLLIGQMSIQKQFGYRYLTTVPSTLYGPGYIAHGKQMHFIFDLIRKILRARETGEPPVLWGDGHQRRELVFIDDFVGNLLRLNAIMENDLINIGAGEDYSIREFAAIICDIVGYDAGLIQYDSSGYVGARSKILDNKKLDRTLPNRPRTPLREGLEKTIEWMTE